MKVHWFRMRDKVAHLGKSHEGIAHGRFVKINKAYQILQKYYQEHPVN